MDFKQFFNGSSPDWTPDVEYKILDDVEMNGIPVRTGNNPVWALVPFCVYGTIPSHKTKFGVEDAEIKEVYPFVELVYSKGEPVDKRANNVIHTSLMAVDKKQKINVALNHIYGELNAFKMMPKEIQYKIKKLCWEKAEMNLEYGDPLLHPHDPDFNETTRKIKEIRICSLPIGAKSDHLGKYPPREYLVAAQYSTGVFVFRPNIKEAQKYIYESQDDKDWVNELLRKIKAIYDRECWIEII